MSEIQPLPSTLAAREVHDVRDDSGEPFYGKVIGVVILIVLLSLTILVVGRICNKIRLWEKARQAERLRVHMEERERMMKLLGFIFRDNGYERVDERSVQWV